MDFELSAEQKAITELASGLAKRNAPDPRVSWDEAGEFSWDFLKTLAEHGLTGIDLPEKFGGQGQSLLDAVLVIEAVASTAPHLADAVHATNFGALRQMTTFCSTQLVEDAIRSVLAGEKIPSIGMSEPGAGSAVHDLTTKARKEPSGIRVNGAKVFNTFGPFANYYIVWARFGTGDRELGAVVVPDTTEGLVRGASKRFISGELYCSLHFDDVLVPLDYLLLDDDGLRKMINVFNIERLGNAARSVGLGQLALRLAVEHMQAHSSGRQPLSSLQGLRWKIADMRVGLDSARLLLYRAATTLRDGLPDGHLVAMAKCAANEAGFSAADTAMQILGGYGYTQESPLEYIWKRTRGWKIAGGSVEVMRNRIASAEFR